LDECDLLFPAPSFDLLFSRQGFVDVLETLEPDRTRALAVCAEAVDSAVAMLF
jgi:hypothetical protein